MNIRITITGSNKTIYSWVEECEESRKVSLGEWKYPFPNTKEESTAFGIAESILQSDYCPMAFQEEEIMSVKVEHEE